MRAFALPEHLTEGGGKEDDGSPGEVGERYEGLNLTFPAEGFELYRHKKVG